MSEDEARRCTECNSPIWSGYVVDGGEGYYCSKDCMLKNMTEEEYLEKYDLGNGETYWTEWGGE